MLKNYFLSASILVICFLSACSNNSTEPNYLPSDGAAGSIQSSTGYSASFTATDTNGDTLVFHVTNKGETTVYVTINDEDATAITLAPSEAGEVSVELTSKPTAYDFKVVPASNGGSISIDYRIDQE